MDPEEKKMLEQTFSLTEENNKMLHRIRRSQKMASLMRFLYWAVIIILAVASYYFVSPYIQQAQNFVKSSGDTLDSFKSFFPKPQQ